MWCNYSGNSLTQSSWELAFQFLLLELCVIHPGLSNKIMMLKLIFGLKKYYLLSVLVIRILCYPTKL